MDNKILLINRCDYTIEEFCNKFFIGCEVIDGYILAYNNEEYEIKTCEPVGMIIQRDIQICRLIKI